MKESDRNEGAAASHLNRKVYSLEAFKHQKKENVTSDVSFCYPNKQLMIKNSH